MREAWTTPCGGAWRSSAGRGCWFRPSSAAARARCSTSSCSSRRWAARGAGALAAPARGGGDTQPLRVPADRRGIARWPLGVIGPEKLLEVAFDGAAVSAEDRRGSSAARRGALQAGALARTAEMVGAAQRVLELAVEYAKTRVQGGRPIGGRQAHPPARAGLLRGRDRFPRLLPPA